MSSMNHPGGVTGIVKFDPIVAQFPCPDFLTQVEISYHSETVTPGSESWRRPGNCITGKLQAGSRNVAFKFNKVYFPMKIATWQNYFIFSWDIHMNQSLRAVTLTVASQFMG
jgi:hypothetical protein